MFYVHAQQTKPSGRSRTTVWRFGSYDGGICDACLARRREARRG